MTVARLAISIDRKLAAERKLRTQGLFQAVREWEKLHGKITKAELRTAVRKRRKCIELQASFS